MEVSGQFHAPAALPPGKESPVPVGQESGWEPVSFWTRWWREKFLAPLGNRTLEPRLSSPWPNRYTDWAITAPYVPYMYGVYVVLYVHVYHEVLRNSMIQGFLQKLMVVRLVKKFPYSGPQIRHWIVFWAVLIQPTFSEFVSEINLNVLMLKSRYLVKTQFFSEPVCLLYNSVR
jgi:hypothetical protein